MNVAKSLKLYTIEEFEQMTKEEHLTYELIDGIVMMLPRPVAISLKGTVMKKCRKL